LQRRCFLASYAREVLDAAGYASERAGADIRVASTSGSGAVTPLLRELTGQVPDPVTVRVHEPTLDDVFLGLTGDVPQARPEPATHTRGGKAA
jgi:hypothetical protein